MDEFTPDYPDIYRGYMADIMWDMEKLCNIIDSDWIDNVDEGSLAIIDAMKEVDGDLDRVRRAIMYKRIKDDKNSD